MLSHMMQNSLVAAVQLQHFLLQLFGLVRGQTQVADVTGPLQLSIIVAQLRLNRVGAQHRVSGERTRQTPRNHVVPQLQTQIIPETERERERERDRKRERERERERDF